MAYVRQYSRMYEYSRKICNHVSGYTKLCNAHARLIYNV